MDLLRKFAVMKLKIKYLYIAAIFAIIAFLAMQAYWLYLRYVSTLSDMEACIYESVIASVKEYNSERSSQLSKLLDSIPVSTNYNTNTAREKNGVKAVTATITSWRVGNAYDMLGRDRNERLTDAEKKIVIDSIMNRIGSFRRECTIDTVSNKVFTLENVPDNYDVMDAMNANRLDDVVPFAVNRMDSILMKNGVDARIELVKSDTIAWSPWKVRHSSVFYPEMAVYYPYDVLERQIAVCRYLIPVSDVIGSMANLLAAAFIVTVLLVFCLVYQIRAIVRFQRLDAMRNNFVSTMIHELKRPIATLKMCVSALENERMMADELTHGEILANSREALDNLSAYFTKLRDITFNNSQQIPLNKQQISLRLMLESLSSTLLVPSGKSVIYCFPDKDVTLFADPVHFSNILGNLIENSIKYSKSDVEVTVAAVRYDDGWNISVTDNGGGIAAKDIDRVFDKYFRSRSAERVPGMGLGLTYVKMLVEAHGGSVSVASRDGTTVFSFNIPDE